MKPFYFPRKFRSSYTTERNCRRLGRIGWDLLFIVFILALSIFVGLMARHNWIAEVGK